MTDTYKLPAGVKSGGAYPVFYPLSNPRDDATREPAQGLIESAGGADGGPGFSGDRGKDWGRFANGGRHSRVHVQGWHALPDRVPGQDQLPLRQGRGLRRLALLARRLPPAYRRHARRRQHAGSFAGLGGDRRQPDRHALSGPQRLLHFRQLRQRRPALHPPGRPVRRLLGHAIFRQAAAGDRRLHTHALAGLVGAALYCSTSLDLYQNGAGTAATKSGSFWFISIHGTPYWCSPDAGYDVPSGPWTVAGLGTVAVGGSSGGGGSGYRVGDGLLLASNGAYTGAGGWVQITSVDPVTGAVTGVSINQAGACYPVAAGYATSGGTGSGCVIDVLTNCPDSSTVNYPVPTSALASGAWLCAARAIASPAGTAPASRM